MMQFKPGDKVIRWTRSMVGLKKGDICIVDKIEASIIGMSVTRCDDNKQFSCLNSKRFIKCTKLSIIFYGASSET